MSLINVSVEYHPNCASFLWKIINTRTKCKLGSGWEETEKVALKKAKEHILLLNKINNNN